MITAHLVLFVQVVQAAHLLLLALAQFVTPTAIIVLDIVQVAKNATAVMVVQEAVLVVIIIVIHVMMYIVGANILLL